ncbi:unnamed protein product, partial [Rotaria sp. Silwood2]
LSDGFKNKHLTWNETLKDKIQKPVIILAANSQFYNTLQASMHTVNDYLKDYTIAIYDLGFIPTQLKMVGNEKVQNNFLTQWIIEKYCDKIDIDISLVLMSDFFKQNTY